VSNKKASDANRRVHILLIDGKMNNADLVSPWLCEAACFAVNYTFSTVPYFSLNEPRNVTLVYNGDQAFRRPFIYADVNGDDPTGIAVSTFTLSATVNGAAVRFLNGSTQLVFMGSGGWTRLAGQYDASSLATNIYPMVVTVKATYNDGLSVTKTVSTQLMILNESGAAVAKGWTIAGVQRLYSAAAGGYLITNGDASGVRFTALNAKASDYSRLTYDNVTATYTRTYPDLSRVVFNSAGQQTKFIDPNGRTSTFAYDGSGRVVQIGDPFRKQPNGSATFIGLSYDGNGLRTIQEPGADGTPWAGRTTSFLVNTSRCLTYAQDPDGVSTNFSCDASGRLATVTDRKGGVTTFAYNATTWKLSTVTLPQIAVDAGGGSTTLTNPVLNFTPWQGTYAINRDSVTGSVTDAAGRTTSFLVDRFGMAADITDPGGHHTTIIRSGILPTRITHPNGWTDTVMYDTLGRVTRNHPAGGSATDYSYIPSNTLSNSIMAIGGPGSRADTVYINAARQVTSVSLHGLPEQEFVFTYDPLTYRVTSITDNSGHRTTYSYDSRFGNVATDTVAGGRVTTRVFDAVGRDSIVAPPGVAAETTFYDPLNRVTRISASATAIVFGYDQLFQTDVYDAKSNHYHTDFNALGWPINQCDALSACETTRYDASGLVMSTTNRRGHVVSVTRDNIGRITSRVGSGLVPNYYSYSTNDRDMVAWNAVELDSVFTNPGTIGTPGAPATDSVVTWIDGKRYRIFHQYPTAVASNLITTISSNTGTTFSTRTVYYSLAGFIDSLKVGGTLVGFLSNGEGGGQSFFLLYTRGTSALATHLTGATTFSNGLAGTFQRGYHYDLSGRIDQVMIGNTANNQQTLSYDALGRLTGQSTRTGCSLIANDSVSGQNYNCTNTVASESYSYDVMGNRTDHGGNYTTGNRIGTFNGISHYYDLDGNVVQKYDGPSGYNREYWWNAENQLDSARKSGWYREKHEYNAFGKPVRTLYAEGTNAFAVRRYLLWDGDALIADFTPNGQRESDYVYLPGTIDRPFGVTTGPTSPATLRFNEVDELANVLGTIENGSVSQSNSYDPFGKVTIAGNAESHLFWKGLFWHGDVTGLIYMRNRWYDQETGRFVNEDPAGFDGGLHLYTFSDNDPINGTDPSGLGEYCSYVPGDQTTAPPRGAGWLVSTVSYAGGWSCYVNSIGAGGTSGLPAVNHRRGGGSGGGRRHEATENPALARWGECGLKAAAAGLSVAIDWFTLGELREGMAMGRLSTQLLARAKQRLARNGMYFGTNVVDDLAASSAKRMLSNGSYGAAFSEIFSSMTNEAKFTGSPWALLPFSGSFSLTIEAGSACYEAVVGG
jgi:RHS repeat-associated protein